MKESTADHTPSAYERLGGEEPLRQLVRRFYENMDELPSVRETRDMHPADLGESEQKLFMFLSGWLGGPQRYMETYGHPRLRMRHAPFAIGKKEADQWMLCMRHALDQTVDDPALREELYHSLYQVADFMRNRD